MSLNLSSKVVSPLRVPISKNKDFILNINNYRNTHYQSLNKSKKVYKEVVSSQIVALPQFSKIKVHYILYPKSNRRTDIGNVIAIHEKYFLDSLVELGKLKDDTYEYVIEGSYTFGKVDPENPRVDIIITEVNDGNQT